MARKSEDTSSHAPVVVWFRQDLRLTDNPAFHAAAATGHPLIALYIHDDTMSLGGASRWWLHGSLEKLDQALQKKGLSLTLRRGRGADELRRLVDETGARGIYWNRCYEPAAIARDRALKAQFKRDGRDVESCNSALLFEPWELKTGSGGPYRVFTPFWRAALKLPPCGPLPAPKKAAAFARKVASDDLADWKLRPTTPDWAGGLRELWAPGEGGAAAAWQTFADEIIRGYHASRDIPGRYGTSRLSPHLHFGEISPHQLWHGLQFLEHGTGVDSFRRELVWREFAHHLLFHFPEMPDAPLRKPYAAFPWRPDRKALAAWQRGRTGYPIVDAGMRELWHTGWMHNRVRMVVASFLVKHLLQPWQDGAAWFLDTLVDADLAANSMNWQWIAGCGMDAAPYFRIFNPVTQGTKFDRRGDYVRRWVPEIAELPDAVLHAPWEASADVLRAAGVVLGKTYPLPIVEHKAARVRALDALKSVTASVS